MAEMDWQAMFELDLASVNFGFGVAILCASFSKEFRLGVMAERWVYALGVALALLAVADAVIDGKPILGWFAWTLAFMRLWWLQPSARTNDGAPPATIARDAPVAHQDRASDS